MEAILFRQTRRQWLADIRKFCNKNKISYECSETGVKVDGVRLDFDEDYQRVIGYMFIDNHLGYIYSFPYRNPRDMVIKLVSHKSIPFRARNYQERKAS